jgi:hypothetical protein
VGHVFGTVFVGQVTGANGATRMCGTLSVTRRQPCKGAGTRFAVPELDVELRRVLVHLGRQRRKLAVPYCGVRLHETDYRIAPNYLRA